MSHKQLESLIGKLQFTSQVIRLGGIFLAHLLDQLRGSPKQGYIAVPVAIMQDIKWWQYVMPILNSTKSIYLDVFFEPGTLINMDATLVGAGGCVKVITFTLHSHNLSPSKLTSLPIWNCWPLWYHLRHGHILLVTPNLWHTFGNMVAVLAINTGHSKDPFINAGLWEIAFLSALHNFEV